jgi:hypothetical protein
MKNRTREICTSGSVRDEDGQPPHLLGRRNFLHLAAGAAALPAGSRIAPLATTAKETVAFGSSLWAVNQYGEGLRSLVRRGRLPALTGENAVKSACCA